MLGFLRNYLWLRFSDAMGSLSIFRFFSIGERSTQDSTTHVFTEFSRVSLGLASSRRPGAGVCPVLRLLASPGLSTGSVERHRTGPLGLWECRPRVQCTTDSFDCNPVDFSTQLVLAVSAGFEPAIDAVNIVAQLIRVIIYLTYQQKSRKLKSWKDCKFVQK